jgi:hypothetical protein
MTVKRVRVCVLACRNVNHTVKLLLLLLLLMKVLLLLLLLFLLLLMLRAQFRQGEQLVCHLSILRSRSRPCCGFIFATPHCRLLLLLEL